MTSDAPNVIVIAGRNGSGKSTAAPSLLRDGLGVTEFVNADVIAQGLSAFGAEAVAISAGRIMLARLKELAEARTDFAFETTLAARTFAVWLRKLKTEGYRTHLVFLWLPTPEMAIARVSGRVRHGGHHIPNETVRRRYFSGLQNFFQLYLPIVDTWRMYDNSRREGYELIAQQLADSERSVKRQEIWEALVKAYQ